MKKILALLLAVVCLFVLTTACSKGTTTDSGSTSDVPTLKAGTLTVGMEIGYPPMEYLGDDGNTYVGFDVDVANEIASRLGLELVIEDTAWDAIFASLDADRYDVIISAVSYTDSRNEQYALTKTYIANKLVIITPLDSAVASPDDLAGLRVAVQTDTTASDKMEELMDGGLAVSEYYVYDKIIQAFDDLKAGRADAVMVDQVVAAYYLGTDSENFKTAWENDEPEPMVLCVKKGNEALRDVLDGVLDEMYSDGKLAEIASNHFNYAATSGVR